jgi:hypothetical protein
MFKTRTIVAVGVFVVALVAVVISRSKKDPHLRSATAAGQSPAGAPAKLVTADVDELQIASPGKPKVTLKKDGTTWKMTEPAADAADQPSVEQALKTLAEVEWKDVIAESKDSYERLQIRDEDVILVTPMKKGVPLETLAIGKSGHVRVGDAPQVWSVGKMNRFAFEKDAKMWRNREIVRFEKDQVDSIEATVDGQKLVVKRIAPPPPAAAPDGGPPAAPAEPEHYTLVDGQAAVGGALDESVPVSILGSLGHLDIAEFADDATPESAGLTAPRAHLEVVLQGGTKKAIDIGKEDGEYAFARVDGRIFKLRKSTADGLVRPPLQWRDKQLVKLNPAEVTKLDILKGTDHTVLEKSGDAWKASEPKDLADFDPSRAQSEASAFANLRGAQISALGAKDAKTGLAKPTGVVKVWTKGGAPTAIVTVGALDGKAYYVQASGRPEVFTVPDAAVNRWLKTPADFKKPAGGDGPPPGMGMNGLPPGMKMMPAGH